MAETEGQGIPLFGASIGKASLTKRFCFDVRNFKYSGIGRGT